MKKEMLGTIVSLLLVLMILAGVVLGAAKQFVDFGKKTVVQTLPSPNGTYEARVIDNDQGALGGDTVVEVQKIGSLTKAKRVYLGEWGEFETMEIYWKSECCLVINGKEYRVD